MIYHQRDFLSTTSQFPTYLPSLPPLQTQNNSFYIIYSKIANGIVEKKICKFGLFLTVGS